MMRQREARPQTWESGRAVRKDDASIADFAAAALVGIGAVGLLFGAVFAWRFGTYPVTQQTVTSAAALAGGLLLAAVRR